MRAIATDGVLALPVEDFYFICVDPAVLSFVVNPILKTMTTHAAGFVGGPGSGKTPLARIMALCASRCSAIVPDHSGLFPCLSVKPRSVTFSVDNQGAKIDPISTMMGEPIRKMKGFTDVGCALLTRERWGAAKFIQGQFRVFVCNDHERTKWVEANQNTRAGVVFYMDHEDFLDITRPVFPRDCESLHIMAVLKRANIIVNAGIILIFRRAT